jgi:phthiodiolone/phenolphthiodiolone dimycocerosates ketoreductase
VNEEGVQTTTRPYASELPDQSGQAHADLRPRLGLTGMSRLPGQRVIDDSVRAEADGADVLLWPDHLMAWHSEAVWTTRYTPLAEHQKNPHEYLGAVPCIAAAAAATRTIRVGSGVTDVMRTHPAVLAQQYLTLHHLSGGRCILGLGVGEGENIVPYGIKMSSPVGTLEEALSIIRLLWESDEPVDQDSPNWPLRGAVLGLGAVPGVGYPPVWVAGNGPRMLDIVGRLADGWLPMLMPPDQYAKRLGLIDRARRSAGVTRPFEPALWTYVCYGQSREDCLALFDSPMYKSLALLLSADAFAEFGMEHPLAAGGLRSFVPTWYDTDALLDLVARVPVEAVAKVVLHGSFDDIVGDLLAFGAAGVRTVVLANVSFLTDGNRVGPSFRAQRELLGMFRSHREADDTRTK